MSLRPSVLIVVAWLILATAFALPAAAQVNTGTIEVDTHGPEGEALPGVAVLVVNTETGARRATVSDFRGLAIIPALDPGRYEVSVSLSGFARAEQEIVIRLGQTAKVAFSMSVLVTASISVTAEVPMVDVYKSDTSTNVTPEQIRDLPVPDRDFQKLAFIAPGVQRERGDFRFIGGSALIGSSGNASETAIVIDGVDFTDQVLGLARARFSQDAIGEFKVVNNRFDTEIGSSAGGALSVVTRSGTNAVHGSVFGFYRSDSLRAIGELEEGTQDYGRYQLGFTLGGPIKRDRTHYFLSYEYINEDSITFFRPQGAFMDLAEDFPVPVSAHLGLASLDRQIGVEQSLGFKLVYEKSDMENFRVGGPADESAGMQLNRENWNLVAGHNWMVADNKVNNIRFQIGRKFFEEPANSDLMAEYFTFGTTLITGANIVGDQEMTGDYISLGDTFNWYLGGSRSGHELKLGASITSIDENWRWPLYPRGAMFYVNDTRAIPYLYSYFVGMTDLEIDTTVFGIFAQDDWRLAPDFTLGFGLRYDYDTDGNNPDFDDSPLVGPRSADSDNIQPRVGFTWDIGGNGATVIRGGAGIFVGRYLLVPAFVELHQNGTSGAVFSRLNGLLLGLPPDFWLDASDPENTGLLLPPNVVPVAGQSRGARGAADEPRLHPTPRRHRPLPGCRGHLLRGRQRDHHPRHQLARQRRPGEDQPPLHGDQQIHQRGSLQVQGADGQPQRHTEGRPRHRLQPDLRRQEEHLRRFQPGRIQLPERLGRPRGRVGARPVGRAVAGGIHRHLQAACELHHRTRLPLRLWTTVEPDRRL